MLILKLSLFLIHVVHPGLVTMASTPFGSSDSDDEHSTATFFLWNQTKITINLKVVIKMFLYNYSFNYL